MKKENTMRTEKNSSGQLAENVLKECKRKMGEVVHVAISARTTFEFPAHLSQAERDIRIENYKNRHKPMLGAQ